MSYKCFQNTNKLRHNVVYAFSVFYGDDITPNLGNYRTDLMILSTALKQSKYLNNFQYYVLDSSLFIGTVVAATAVGRIECKWRTAGYLKASIWD